MKLQASWLKLLALTPGIIINIISFFLWHVIPFLASHPNLPTPLVLGACCLSHACNLRAQAFSGTRSVFIALFISFIATEPSSSLVSFFGLGSRFSPIERVVWILGSTWTNLKDNWKHGYLCETLFYDCWLKKLFPLMVLGDTVRWEGAEPNNWSTESEMVRGVLMTGFSSDEGSQVLILFHLPALPLSFRFILSSSQVLRLFFTVAVMKKEYCRSVLFFFFAGRFSWKIVTQVESDWLRESRSAYSHPLLSTICWNAVFAHTAQLSIKLLSSFHPCGSLSMQTDFPNSLGPWPLKSAWGM